MVELFWTISQKDEIKKYCQEYRIPQCIQEELFRIIQILDTNYGINRKLEEDGGYVALIVGENYFEEYRKILEKYNLKECYVEIQDVFPITEEKEWCSDLYIVTNDYGITIMYPHER